MNPLTGVLNEAWNLYHRYAPHLVLISFTIYLVVAVVSAILVAVLGGFGVFLGDILSVFGMFLTQAALVKAVQDVRDGCADLSVRETVSAALPFIGAVALASILASIAIAIGFALIIVPGLILVTFLSLIVPCIVIGGTGTLVAPFIAAVVTLIYYRLSAAHGEAASPSQPVPTGPYKESVNTCAYMAPVASGFGEVTVVLLQGPV